MAFDPWLGDRRPAAWTVILKRLGDHKWHDWYEVQDEAAAASNMLPRSVANMMLEAVRAGALGRRDDYYGTMHKRQVYLARSCPERFLSQPGRTVTP